MPLFYLLWRARTGIVLYCDFHIHFLHSGLVILTGTTMLHAGDYLNDDTQDPSQDAAGLGRSLNLRFCV